MTKPKELESSRPWHWRFIVHGPVGVYVSGLPVDLGGRECEFFLYHPRRGGRFSIEGDQNADFSGLSILYAKSGKVALPFLHGFRTWVEKDEVWSLPENAVCRTDALDKLDFMIRCCEVWPDAHVKA